jgi:hypothetical protein
MKNPKKNPIHYTLIVQCNLCEDILKANIRTGLMGCSCGNLMIDGGHRARILSDGDNNAFTIIE